ncbi:MAG: coproporphyrinogen III oxidase [Planktomarina sp.]|uniref:radical SAM family heme chaperone HemW n=1 Tax=Planktomarina sp. TaxID=2024851 RepID=UPI00325FE280|nr:coproporphyrinogen III oxidase [Planktomarina sp.]
MEDWRHGGFGLYIHWPFCESKCPYCDFNSYVSATVDNALWEAALLSELDRHAALTPDRLLNSIFFGGGTPSLMPPKMVGRLIDRARSQWSFANDIEITLEANPSSVEASRFADFRAAGVNRVSMGIQALNDPDLKRLGRLHSVAEARSALAVAKAYFDRVSFDLIYARQDQTLEAWQSELTQAIEMSAGHLSLYQLTVEPGTAFGFRAQAGKLGGLPDEDLSADMFEVTQEVCAQAGLHGYEVSNHSNKSLESKHNMIYWRGGDYIGIGPGAHGRLTLSGMRHATRTALAPQAWLERVAQRNTGTSHQEILAPRDHANELIMMGLRVSDGISRRRIEGIAGAPLNIPDHLLDLGLLELSDTQLRATRTGRPLLNQLVQALMY